MVFMSMGFNICRLKQNIALRSLEPVDYKGHFPRKKSFPLDHMLCFLPVFKKSIAAYKDH